jgi:Transposase, Mutator family
VAANALTMKVREDGRIVKAVMLVATGVNPDGYRNVLGMRARSATGLALPGSMPRRPGCHIGQYQAWRPVMPAHVTNHAAMKNTQEPPFGTPGYEMLGLERIVSTAGEGREGVGAFLTATVTFAGDGDGPGSGGLPAGR